MSRKEQSRCDCSGCSQYNGVVTILKSTNPFLKALIACGVEWLEIFNYVDKVCETSLISATKINEVQFRLLRS